MQEISSMYVAIVTFNYTILYTLQIPLRATKLFTEQITSEIYYSTMTL